jgi:hypothetical protein
MNSASPLTQEIYHHINGLKHINIVDGTGFSAIFVVNTPIFDNSGVAHGVEHMVFRRSVAFPKSETLFQLSSLTDAKINASTLADTTYFHCQSQSAETFILAINYLLNGLFNPIFDTEDMHCEIHNGNNKGVIYRELIGIEQATHQGAKSPRNNIQDDFCYGGVSTSIGDLTLTDLKMFHQRYYQATNITLVTANADIEQISNLVGLLPKKQSSKQKKIALDKHKNPSQQHASKEFQQTKYSEAINKLIHVYHLWLQQPHLQKVVNYRDIKSADKPLTSNSDALPVISKGDLIVPLVILSDRLIKGAVNDKSINIAIKTSSNIQLLPQILSKLCQQAKRQLSINELNAHKNQTYVTDERNTLWLTNIEANEYILANIASYIISAYPKFLTPRCHGLCYAIQALTIENSAYLAIFSVFDIYPNTRLKNILFCLESLSEDSHFISMSLALAKIKYCQTYQVNNSQVVNITPTDISAYLQTLSNRSHL